MNNFIDVDAMIINPTELRCMASQAFAADLVKQCDYLKAIDYVKDAVVITDGETVIVSVVTLPIYMASVRNNVTEQIITAVKTEENAERILVSYDTDIYYKSARASDLKDFESILKLVTERS